MDLPTLTMAVATIGLAVFILGGVRVSLRSGVVGRSMLANIGLSKPERAAQRDKFWAEVFGPAGRLDRWLIFGGAAGCAAAMLALNALV